MKSGPLLAAISVLAATACALYAQRPFREYPAWEYNNFPLPPDYLVPGEWTFARLMYPTTRFNIDWQSEYKRGYDWREGNTNWTIDYPRADRHLALAVRRLTRINARSAEQPINLDDEQEDVFNYPWLLATEAGHWELTDSQIAKFREYLLRGGFFMCDDFHGTDEWNIFIASMSKVLPGRPIVDIQNNDPIFHTVYDLSDRFQVPGMQFTQTGSICEKCNAGGAEPHWRAIYDDNGRIMVAMLHNQDNGDSWENADDPKYPQQYSAQGLRIGVNYIIYSMSH